MQFYFTWNKKLLVIRTGPTEMEMAGKWIDIVMMSDKGLEKYEAIDMDDTNEAKVWDKRETVNKDVTLEDMNEQEKNET